MIAWRDDDDALVRAVGPVREAAAGELARRLLPANAFVERILPERLARGRIDRERLAMRRGDGEETTVRVERRRAIVLVVAELARVPSPRDLERVEVRRVDLVGRRVARAPRVGAPVAPFAGLVAARQRRALSRARLRRLGRQCATAARTPAAITVATNRRQPVSQRCIMASSPLRWRYQPASHRSGTSSMNQRRDRARPSPSAAR